jgi:hypothetical protein
MNGLEEPLKRMCYKPDYGKGNTHTTLLYWLILRRKCGRSDTSYRRLPIIGSTGREYITTFDTKALAERHIFQETQFQNVLMN